MIERLRYLIKYDKTVVSIIGLIGVVLIGFLDHAKSIEMSFSLFYLLPVFYVAWSAGEGPAFMVAIACVIARCLANPFETEMPSTPLVYYWNAFARLFILLIVAVLLARLKQALSRERQMARIDFVTGAATSRAFYEITEKEISRAHRYGHPFTVAYIDIDDFKMINDRFGHVAGNRALKSVVGSISQNLRANDVVARMGGDEFVVLLVETGYEAARVVMTKIQQVLLERMGDLGYPVTFSIGSLTCNVPPESIDELIHAADQLMYAVKANGKNAIRFSIGWPRAVDNPESRQGREAGKITPEMGTNNPRS